MSHARSTGGLAIGSPSMRQVRQAADSITLQLCLEYQEIPFDFQLASIE
jgi:hypothetical protein